MTYALVRLTTDQLKFLREEASEFLDLAVTQVEAEDWSGVVQALADAFLIEPPNQGRRPDVPDAELLGAFQRLRTVRAVCKEFGYSDHYHVSQRLRTLGCIVRRGRPRNRPAS